MTRLLTSLLLWPLCALATDIPSPTLDAALAEAAARKAPVLVDFHAPWCYSCYYMAHNVLTGADWDTLRKQTVVLELDADSPEGDALKTRWQVKAMPSYLVLDPQGRELGRILGEQTRHDFYARIHELIGRGATLETLAARVNDAGKASVAAAREVLKSYHARYDADGGLAWLDQLPAAAKSAVLADPAGALWTRRLAFLQATQRKDAKGCVDAGAQTLAGNLGCDRAYELDRFLQCTDGVPQRTELLKAQRAANDALVADGGFGKHRCADQRSVVLTAADLYAALGDKPAEARVLDRAILDTRQRMGADLKRDRNLADNLRVLLDRAGRTEELDALLVRLVDAYPDDYVYAYRHGRNLLARGQAGAALPFLDRAATKAYGINRLKVAQLRVQALQQLKRDAEARQVVAEALQANGPWFPDEAAKLKAMVQAKG